jgi:hypothetical protein
MYGQSYLASGNRPLCAASPDHFLLPLVLPLITADLFMLDTVHQLSVDSNINLLCLDIADHLLFQMPQMNAVPIMSRALYHVP